MTEKHTFTTIPKKILLPVDFSPSSEAAVKMVSRSGAPLQCSAPSCQRNPIFTHYNDADFVPKRSFISKQWRMPSTILKSTESH